MLRRTLIYYTLWTMTCAAPTIRKPRQANLPPPDIVQSGSYLIVNCGPQASQVDTALKTLWTTLQPVLADANQRFPSPAYITFFHDILNAPFIASVFAQITTGASVTPGNVIAGINSSPPVIACATNPDTDPATHTPTRRTILTALIAKGYILCGKEPAALAYQFDGTPVVALCPRFFTRPLAPAHGKCLKLLPGNTAYYQGLGGGLLYTQVSVLLHELVHFYVNSVVPHRANEPLPAEPYTPNQCLLLSATEAKLNPSNYELYAWNVYHKCTNFPPLPHWRKLLSSNSTVGEAALQPAGYHGNLDDPVVLTEGVSLNEVLA